MTGSYLSGVMTYTPTTNSDPVFYFCYNDGKIVMAAFRFGELLTAARVQMFREANTIWTDTPLGLKCIKGSVKQCGRFVNGKKSAYA